ncbi:polyketide synthase dehydratase domain-containing protein [Streptomyces nogalater]
MAAADDTGHRALTVHSAPRAPTTPPGPGTPPACSPPPRRARLRPHRLAAPGARPVPAEDAYDRLAALGYDYGPAFQGLRALWRRGEETFAEVELPVDAGTFALHPALFDAALHADVLTADGQDTARLPFSWTGVSLYAAGATALRVRLHGTADTLALQLADPTGAPVAAVEALVSRPVDPAALASAARTDALYRLDWPALPLPEAPAPEYAVLDERGPAALETLPAWAVLPAAATARAPAPTGRPRAC